MSSFLARSFRRTLHARHEGQIIKAISAGQNLEVSYTPFMIFRFLTLSALGSRQYLAHFSGTRSDC